MSIPNEESANRRLWSPAIIIQLWIVELPAVKHLRPLAVNVVWLLIRWIHYYYDVKVRAL